MSFLTTLASAFKGGGGHSHVPIGRGFVSPWAAAFEASPRTPPFDYAAAVREGYLANPVAQRSVRIVAEGVGGAPLAAADPALERLLRVSCSTTPLLEVLAAQLLLHGRPWRVSTPWSSRWCLARPAARPPIPAPATATSSQEGPRAAGPDMTATSPFGRRASGCSSRHTRARGCSISPMEPLRITTLLTDGSEWWRPPCRRVGRSRTAKRVARLHR